MPTYDITKAPESAVSVTCQYLNHKGVDCNVDKKGKKLFTADLNFLNNKDKLKIMNYMREYNINHLLDENIVTEETDVTFLGLPKLTALRLEVGKKYIWLGGAEPLDVVYIGRKDANKDLPIGSSLGKGFVFQFVDKNKYMELGPVAINQSLTKPEWYNKEEEITEEIVNTKPVVNKENNTILFPSEGSAKDAINKLGPKYNMLCKRTGNKIKFNQDAAFKFAMELFDTTIKEINTTSDVAGYDTPKAFGKNKRNYSWSKVNENFVGGSLKKMINEEDWSAKKDLEQMQKDSNRIRNNPETIALAKEFANSGKPIHIFAAEKGITDSEQITHIIDLSTSNLNEEELPKKIKYDGQSKLEPNTIIKFGRFNQFKLQVVEDLGDKLRVINIMKNYKKDPYTLNKLQIKGSTIELPVSKNEGMKDMVKEATDKGHEILHTLKTKAKSGKYEYNVNIIQGKILPSVTHYTGKVLSIEDTPGSWYLDTLLVGPHSTRTYSKLSIQGHDWLIDNWQEILKELIPLSKQYENNTVEEGKINEDQEGEELKNKLTKLNSSDYKKVSDLSKEIVIMKRDKVNSTDIDRKKEELKKIAGTDDAMGVMVYTKMNEGLAFTYNKLKKLIG